MKKKRAFIYVCDGVYELDVDQIVVSKMSFRVCKSLKQAVIRFSAAFPEYHVVH